jgi:hypothetical protein
MVRDCGPGCNKNRKTQKIAIGGGGGEGTRDTGHGVEVESWFRPHRGSLPLGCGIIGRILSVPLFSYISPDAPSFLSNGTRVTGHGSRGRGRDLVSTLLANPPVRYGITNEIFSAPLFSYISPDAPSFFENRSQDSGARSWNSRLEALLLPSGFCGSIDRFSPFLCFHTYRRMHLRFCETGQGKRDKGKVVRVQVGGG